MTNVIVMADEIFRFLNMSVYEWVISVITFLLLLATSIYAYSQGIAEKYRCR